MLQNLDSVTLSGNTCSTRQAKSNILHNYNGFKLKITHCLQKYSVAVIQEVKALQKITRLHDEC